MGSIGGGAGATVGKILGPAFMMKGGLGSASVQLPDGTIIAALVVVNALGDIIDPHTQQVVAGASNPSRKAFLGANPFSNTTIAVIATSASLTKDEI
jgi:L-aminopeptidase/D-esterase-like protein